MAMQMLSAGGFPVITDGVRQADEDNPKGYFEQELVKDLHKDGEDRSWVQTTRGRAIKIISFLLRHLPEQNNYKVIFMRRDLPEVLASQTKMLERLGAPNGTSDDHMFKLWKDHLWKINYFMRHTGHIDFIDVIYRDVVDAPAEYAARICDFVGSPMDIDKMAAIVDPCLSRN